MVLTSLQAQILINQFNNLNITQTVCMDDVKYVIRSFEGTINYVDP